MRFSLRDHPGGFASPDSRGDGHAPGLRAEGRASSRKPMAQRTPRTFDLGARIGRDWSHDAPRTRRQGVRALVGQPRLSHSPAMFPAGGPATSGQPPQLPIVGGVAASRL
jgi:hypothetical protein